MQWLKVNDAYRPRTRRQVSPRLSLFGFYLLCETLTYRNVKSELRNSQKHGIICTQWWKKL